MKKIIIAALAALCLATPSATPAAAKDILPEGVVKMNPFVSGLPEKIETWKVFKGDPSGDPTAINIDDSAWEKAAPGYSWNGRGAYCWFRAKFKLPASAEGKPVYLELAVDDGGEVYAEGKKLGDFSGGGSFLLTSSGKTGQEISLALKGVNGEGIAALTFAGYRIVSNPDIIKVEKAIDALKAYRSISVQDIGGWKYSSKGSKSAASPETDDSDWKQVGSSFTWDASESIGWFRTKFTVPSTINGFPTSGGKVKLLFGVKDSADIYVNGKKIENIVGSGAVEIPSKIAPGSELLLALKVSRLAGFGGLGHAKVQGESIIDAQNTIAALAAQLDSVAALLKQLPVAPQEISAAVEATANKVAEFSGVTDLAEMKKKIDAAAQALSPINAYMEKYPVFLKGPYLQFVKPDAITIMWQTSVPVDSAVYYGKDSLSSVARDPEKKTMHEMTITGLDRETAYKYVAVSGLMSSPEGRFRTSIKRDTPFVFTVWGDNRTDSASHENVVDGMIAANPDIAINVGDVVTNGSSYEQWGKEYFIPIRRLAQNVPTYVAIGNHEYGGYGYGKPVLWYEQFIHHEPNDYYYTFTYGNSIFMALNPQDEAPCCNIRVGSAQYEWMIKQFESDEWKNADFRFVFIHEPPYSEAWSGGYYDGEQALRNNLVPLLEKYDVDIVFSGHTHDYERGQWPKPDGPYYIITGGGGASLDDTIYKDWEQMDLVLFKYHFIKVSIDGKTLKFDALDPKGNLLDSFSIKK